MKPPLKIPEYVYNACCCSQVGYCMVLNKVVSVDDIFNCRHMTTKQRKEICHNSQSDVQRYNEFMKHGYDYKWFEYWDNTHNDKNDCIKAIVHQNKKDKKIIYHLEHQDKQADNGFDKVEIACLGHYDKQFSFTDSVPYLKKINLNNLKCGKYQNNKWAESRAFIDRSIFSNDAEYLGFVSASWNDKFEPNRIDNFHNWPYSKYLVNSDKLVFCANVNCCCAWKNIIKGIIKGHDNIFNKLQELLNLEIYHVKVPYCNTFIAHRSIVEEYLNYLDSEQIMAKIEDFVQREVVKDFLGEYNKHRIEAYIMEMVNCFWWAKKDYMYISNASRKQTWYSEKNNNQRLKDYEDSLLDNNS